MRQLVEEVGDLRYDALCEFFVLLSQKLKRDGAKDLSRGRSRLGSALVNAGKALDQVGEHINTAWQISKPYLKNIFPKDIQDFIKANFSGKDFTEIILLLYDFQSGSQDTSLRIIRSLLYVSSGSISKLKEEIRQFDDYRDLLLSAEYDNQLEMKRNFNNPFGEEHKLNTGLEDSKDSKSLQNSEDDLPF